MSTRHAPIFIARGRTSGVPTGDVARGLRDALPVMLAYVPVGATYGVLATSAHLPIWLTVLASLVIYAGASQFMLVSLSVVGIAALPLTLTLLLVNLRHLLYGTSIGAVFRAWRTRQKLIAGFGLTDEVFAISSTRLTDPDTAAAVTPAYQYALSFACYASWVGGSAIGAGIGSVVPASVGAVLSFALPALFIGLLLSTARKLPQLAAALCGAATAVVAQAYGSPSLGIVAGGLVGATVGMLVARRRPLDVRS